MQSYGGQKNGKENLWIGLQITDTQCLINIILKNDNKEQRVEEIPNIASLTVYGPHFREKPAISGEMCSTLGKANVNILGISTSISSVCCLIKDEEYYRAYDALLKVFQLP